MGRPERNTVDYFPHFIGNGKKIFSIEAKYGNDGYAVWFKILEKLAGTDYHFLNLTDEAELIYLSARCYITEDRLISIINDLCRLGVFDKKAWDKRIIWSQQFIDSIIDVYERRNNKCMNYESLCKHLIGLGIHLVDVNHVNVDINTQTKLNYTKVKESKLNKSGIDFDFFWNDYDKKVGEKVKIKKKWDILDEETQNRILDHIPKYKLSQPEKQYRKNPETYLNNKSWLDEIIDRKEKNSGEKEKKGKIEQIIETGTQVLYNNPFRHGNTNN